MGQVIQMVANGTGGTQSGLSAFDVPSDGFITGVEWACSATLDTTGDFCLWQVSFSNTYNNQNDARNVIANANAGNAYIGTGGSTRGQCSGYTHLPDLPVAAGERIFLHVHASLTTTSTGIVLVCLSSNQARPSVRR